MLFCASSFFSTEHLNIKNKPFTAYASGHNPPTRFGILTSSAPVFGNLPSSSHLPFTPWRHHLRSTFSLDGGSYKESRLPLPFLGCLVGVSGAFPADIALYPEAEKKGLLSTGSSCSRQA